MGPLGRDSALSAHRRRADFGRRHRRVAGAIGRERTKHRARTTGRDAGFAGQAHLAHFGRAGAAADSIGRHARADDRRYQRQIGGQNGAVAYSQYARRDFHRVVRGQYRRAGPGPHHRRAHALGQIQRYAEYADRFSGQRPEKHSGAAGQRRQSNQRNFHRRFVWRGAAPLQRYADSHRRRRRAHRARNADRGC